MGVFLEILKVVSNKNSYQTNDGWNVVCLVSAPCDKYCKLSAW